VLGETGTRYNSTALKNQSEKGGSGKGNRREAASVLAFVVALRCCLNGTPT
jgi:hypothetical protein